MKLTDEEVQTWVDFVDLTGRKELMFIRSAMEELLSLRKQVAWNYNMDEAPKDCDIDILTSDGYSVQGFWDPEKLDFYKSSDEFITYDPDNCKGTWCSVLMPQAIGEKFDSRMNCGYTPQAWRLLPQQQ